MGRLAPKVFIELDISRPMTFSMNAAKEFEKMSGVRIVDPAFNMGSPEMLVNLVYCACKDADPTFSLTIEDVGKQLSFADAPHIIAKICKLTDTPIPEAITEMLIQRGIDPNSI